MANAKLKDGILWAFRLLLNREPDSIHTIEQMAALYNSPEEIRKAFIGSAEYALRFDVCGGAPSPRTFPVDLREGVAWAYRFYFQQEPDVGRIAYQHSRVHSIEDIQAVFLMSREFEIADGYGIRDLADVYVLRKFAPFNKAAAPVGFFNDFLGSKTRIAYLPEFFAYKSGTSEGGPNTSARGMHGASEWIGTLRSVLEATSSVVAVELGAGWAPWLVSVAAAANKRGIKDIRLFGVEASGEHFQFCKQHFRDNGLNPEEHCLLNAVVGAEDGVARFPKLIDPSNHYGANAVFGEQKENQDLGFERWEEIRSISIKTLLKDVDRVDILHCDIQGAETSVLTAAMPTLDAKCRRMVIGTHSRLIDGEILHMFADSGWILEYEQPAKIHQRLDCALETVIDGEQVWRNPRLAPYS